MATQVRIRGAREMEMTLRQLPDYIAKHVVVGALRKAAVPILDEARRLAPVGDESKGRARLRRTKGGRVTVANYGKLKQSLKIISVPVKLTMHSATVAVSVGKAFWGVWVEFGKRSNPNYPKQPFMRPAFDSKAAEALRVLGQELGNGIDKAAEKLAGPLAKSGLKRR